MPLLTPTLCVPPGWCWLLPAVPVFTGCSLSSNPTGAGLLRVGSLQGVDLEPTPLLWTDGSPLLVLPCWEGEDLSFSQQGISLSFQPLFSFLDPSLVKTLLAQREPP